MAVLLDDRVTTYIERHAMVADGDRVLAMVSGGADSMCVMHLLAERYPGRLGVVSVDHGLRSDAAGEVRAVALAARELGVPVWCERLDLRGGAAVQQRARDARFMVARRLAATEGFTRIATGHTASDQAETVLFRIARGTGRTGALGMGAVDGDIIRPLLCVTADETRAWCRARGLKVVEDPSNVDPRYARSRVRHGLIPALAQVHPGAERAVVRFAEHLRDEANLLEEIVDEAWLRCYAGAGLDVSHLGREVPALARLLVRRLIRDADLTADSVWVDRCLALAARAGGTIQIPGGCAAVDRGVLVVEGPPPTAPEPVVLTVPGQVRFGHRIVRATRGVGGSRLPTCVAVAVDGPFVVRGPLPGDRLPLAGGGRQAVGTLLAGLGVPARHRSSVPIIAVDGRVVWVGGYRADPTLLAAPTASATVLEVTDA